MMLSAPPAFCHVFYCIFLLFCGKILVFCEKVNKVCLVGMTTFILQVFLATLVIMDQLVNVKELHDTMLHFFRFNVEYNPPSSGSNLFSLPISPSPFVTVAQFLVIPLPLITQIDILSLMVTLYELRHQG